MAGIDCAMGKWGQIKNKSFPRFNFDLTPFFTLVEMTGGLVVVSQLSPWTILIF
jgi:hypothetical protein